MERVGKSQPARLQRAALFGGISTLVVGAVLAQAAFQLEGKKMGIGLGLVFFVPAAVLVGAEMGLLDAVLLRRRPAK